MAKNAMSAILLKSHHCFSLKYHIQIDAYEVLVEANLPTRWVYHPLLTSLPIPRPLDGTTASFDPRPALQLTLA
jgi:hypothetical protein